MSLLVCNYRKKLFLFVHFLLLMWFSTFTAFKLTQTVPLTSLNFSTTSAPASLLFYIGGRTSAFNGNCSTGSSKFEDNPTSSTSIFGSGVGISATGSRAAGLRAGSISTYDDQMNDPRENGWNPPSRHRILRTNSLEG